MAAHRRALVVQRTGWGKSAVYFVATALLRARGAGPTVIVSPLLALMRNQIAAADRAGIHAVTINSTNNDAWARPTPRSSRARSTSCWSARSASTTPSSATRSCRTWPRRPACWSSTRPTASPTGATTSGPTTGGSGPCSPTFRRASRSWPRPRPPTPASPRTWPSSSRSPGTACSTTYWSCAATSTGSRCTWASSSCPARPRGWPGWPSTWASCPAPASSTASRSRPPRRSPSTCAARATTSRRTPGQTETAERLAAEDDLLADRLKALVATSALGMGFDMPDLGWVVNLGAPASPIAYYQQVGRAGRAIDRAVAVLLPGREDRDIWDYFGSLAFPTEPEVRQALAVLGEPDRPLSTAALEPHVTLRRTRLEMMLKVLDVDGAVRRVRGGWVATGEPWAYDADRYDAGPRDARSRAGGDAGIRCDARLPDGVPADCPRRPGCPEVRALRQLRRPRPGGDRVRGGGRAGPAAPGPPRRRRRAAQALADRHGRRRRRAQPAGSRPRSRPSLDGPSPG